MVTAEPNHKTEKSQWSPVEGSGIGLATAQRFVQEGAYTFIFGRGQSEIDAAVRRIGKNVIGVQGDVSNLADLDRLYDTVKQQKDWSLG